MSPSIHPFIGLALPYHPPALSSSSRGSIIVFFPFLKIITTRYVFTSSSCCNIYAQCPPFDGPFLHLDASGGGGRNKKRVFFFCFQSSFVSWLLRLDVFLWWRGFVDIMTKRMGGHHEHLLSLVGRLVAGLFYEDSILFPYHLIRIFLFFSECVCVLRERKAKENIIGYLILFYPLIDLRHHHHHHDGHGRRHLLSHLINHENFMSHDEPSLSPLSNNVSYKSHGNIPSLSSQYPPIYLQISSSLSHHSSLFSFHYRARLFSLQKTSQRN